MHQLVSTPTARRHPRMALVTSGLGPSCGGVGVVAQLMANGLAEETCLSIWRHHRAGWPGPLRRMATFLGAAYAAKHRPERILYDHLDLAQLSTLLPRLRGIPYAIFLHGTEVWVPVTGRKKQALQGAAVLLASSHFTISRARAVNPWLPEVQITHPGVARRFFDQRPRRQPTAVIVGRMHKSERQKGHDSILNAWPAVVEKVPSATLKIIGDGNDRPRLEERVKAERIENVQFLGWIADDDRDRHYASSRLFALPSLQEGFGIAAVEAAAMGLPVLGIKGTVMEELFPAGQGAVLIESAEASSIAAAAIPLLLDGSRAEELGAKAKARVEEHFLEEKFHERFRTALEPLLNS